MITTKSYGETAFDAYNEAKGGVTYDGKPIPTWDKLTPDVRAAWEAAGVAVRDACKGAQLPRTAES